jgi:hypothetical protein
VTLDDVLDNTNANCYVLKQTLRDCARAITSSGANAIWDVSSPKFRFEPTSRSEDLATSLENIPKSLSVYKVDKVSVGVAKETVDYIDALYRWAAGPSELFFPSLFQFRYVKRYLTIFVPYASFAFACFFENPVWVVIYYAIVLCFALKYVYDAYVVKAAYPLRDFVISTIMFQTLFLNTLSATFSPIWMIVLPVYSCVWGKIPLSATDGQLYFWGFMAIGGGLIGTALQNSASVYLAKRCCPAVVDWLRLQSHGSCGRHLERV